MSPVLASFQIDPSLFGYESSIRIITFLSDVYKSCLSFAGASRTGGTILFRRGSTYAHAMYEPPNQFVLTAFHL